ncbi:MAG: hypothetical protein II922_12300 [Succinimonas sp.]|nr:hypothetical protein [Succinimonas sp.]
MSNNLVTDAINSVLNGLGSFCKFFSANDSGETGAHQSGLLISKSAKGMFFTESELAEHIFKIYGTARWQKDFSTPCTITWYASKNEIRITGFGKGFPFIRPEYTGALFVMVKLNEGAFENYVFNTDDEIQEFLDAFGLTPAETNRPINVSSAIPSAVQGCNSQSLEAIERQAIDNFIQGLKSEFPSSSEMSRVAREIFDTVHGKKKLVVKDPDKIILDWTDQEYTLFKAIEQARYGDIVRQGFSSVEDFVVMANQVLNRRKSRAGKSLEHHLSFIFDYNDIIYTAQAVTEGNKKPDFLFPSEDAYHDVNFSVDYLCTLAAKTTCKDRWRQILNEADRLRDKTKYLCTMQQGISAAQMDEMYRENVVLVVPKAYISSYPPNKQDRIWTIKQFVDHVKKLEEDSGWPISNQRKPAATI